MGCEVFYCNSVTRPSIWEWRVAAGREVNNPRLAHRPRLTSRQYLDGHVDVEKSFLEILLLHPAGNVAEVEGGGGRVDVLVVLAAGLLEPVKARVGVVFGQTSVGLTVLWQLK